MFSKKFSNKELKNYYISLFKEKDADKSPENFQEFLKIVIGDLSWDLKVDLSLMKKEYDDPILCKVRHLGAIEALKRVLLPVAEGANYKATQHPDWSLLAGRLEIQRLKLQVPETFKEMLNKNPSIWRGRPSNEMTEEEKNKIVEVKKTQALINELSEKNLKIDEVITKINNTNFEFNEQEDNNIDYYNFVNDNAEELESLIKPERDYDLYFFGVRTLEKSYLMRTFTGGDFLLETPQRMYLRIATFLWMSDIAKIKEFYDLLSTGAFTHASPTMFHSGIAKGSLASCFLLSMQDDLEKIFKCLGQCALISKSAGGIGLDITNIRHSKVGHLGQSSGIVPMLKVYDAGMRYVDQCFDPETYVYTKKGPMKIGEVSTGDKLITLDGFGTVAKPMHYKYFSDKQMYSLEINHYHKDVKVAGVHPLLSIPTRYNMTELHIIKDHLQKEIIKPEFIPVDQLSKGGIVGLPIPKYEKDIPTYDEDDCYMYGLLIGCGHSCSSRNEFNIKLNKTNEYLLSFVKNYLDNAKLYYWIKEKENTITFYWEGGAMFPFNRSMLYNNNEKAIHYSMLHLPKNKVLCLLKGLIHVKGTYTSNISLSNNSEQIIESVKYILLRFGIPVSNYLEPYKSNYRINIPKVKEISKLFNLVGYKKYNNYFIWNNILFTIISKLNKIKYTNDTIVELEMLDQTETGANYLTSIGLAHNGGRRKGSAAIFLQPWHIDFPDFVLLKRQHGVEERRARDLFYSVWTCDIFMKRVHNDEEWTLFCPKYTPMLRDTYGEEFDKWYLHYEKELPLNPDSDNYVKKVSARKLWDEILTTQCESGMPFITYKDTANYTSNQKNLGVIRSSNLCVSGDTYILTKNGQIPIKDVVGKTIKVWNGEEWSEVTPFCTSVEPKKLLTVNFNDGTTLNCTPEHKFYVFKNNNIIQKDAKNLQPNDELLPLILPNFMEINHGIDKFNTDIEIPINSQINTKISWLKKYIKKNGSMVNENLHLKDEKCLLLKIKLMLQTLGIYSKIYTIEHYNSLVINKNNLYILYNNPNLKLKLSKKPSVPTDIIINTVSVLNIENNGIKEPTYCFTEPKRHLGVFNGLLTGQCQEIVEVTDGDTISSCNLASLSLDEYVKTENGVTKYDFDKLGRVTRLAVQSLNRVIDRTFYPIQEKDNNGNLIGPGPIKKTNLKYRPLGLGVNALADTFLKMNLAWTDKEAKELNREIFATIYYNAIDESCNLAIKEGTYQGFNGSPSSMGLLKPDLIALEKARKTLYIENLPTTDEKYKSRLNELTQQYLKENLSNKYNWDDLRNKVKNNGLRNSLLIALMPTASSAQIRYKNESFEPFTSNMYVRSVLAGNHIIMNRYMVKELEELNLWNNSLINFIMKNDGSIKDLPLDLLTEEDKKEKLKHLKEKCLTAFEIPQKLIVDMSIDRSYYVCQSQSLNIHIKNPTFRQLTSLHFYGWKNALTTGMYYLRTAPSTEAIKFTVEGELDVKKSVVCTDDICISCQS